MGHDNSRPLLSSVPKDLTIADNFLQRSLRCFGDDCSHQLPAL
jgi:hypothetical protein